MMQFNEDGSLKLSQGTIKKKQETEDRLKRARCIKIHKEMVNFSAPKKCLLHITLSDAITDNRFIESTHKYFKDQCETPTKIIKLNEKEFDIEIGTNFKRCSDCTNLIKRYRQFLDDNVIEEKGNCTYESFKSQNFCYEDYFE
jgi:endonuclease III